MLYLKSVPSDEFHLIMKGKVLVCSGNEKFFVELSSFHFLGVDALLNDNFKPDFSAKAVEKTRLLRIKRVDYRKAISSVANVNRK